MFCFKGYGHNGHLGHVTWTVLNKVLSPVMTMCMYQSRGRQPPGVNASIAINLLSIAARFLPILQQFSRLNTYNTGS